MPQPNIQNMLKQAQEVMAAQQEAQDALKEQRVEASAGGGMVKVVVTGDLKMESLKDERVEASAGGGMVKVVATGELAIESITIDPAAVDPEDVEMLQDTVLAAVNEALRSAQELAASKMGNVTGGLGGPGGGLGGLGLPGL